MKALSIFPWMLAASTVAAPVALASYPTPQRGTVSPEDVARVMLEAELAPPLVGEWENNEARERDAQLIAERAEAAELRGVVDDNDTAHYSRGTTLILHVFISHTGATWDTNEMNTAGAKADAAKNWYTSTAWWPANKRFDGTGNYFFYSVSVPYSIGYDGLNESIMEDALSRLGFGDGDGDGWRIDDATHYLQGWGGGWDNVIMCFEPDQGGRAWASYGHAKCELYTDSAWNVFAHEWGHLFGACDEYAEGGSCNGGTNCGACQSWYLTETVNNTNCELAMCGTTVDCLMKYNSTGNLCGSTPRHWAWADDNGDGIGNNVRRPVGAGPTYATIWELFHNGWFLWNNTSEAEVVSQRSPNWGVIGLRSPGAADYDLQVFTDNTHNVFLGSSAWGTGQVDWVVGDYHHNVIGNEHIQLIHYGGNFDNYNLTYESGGEVLYPDGIVRSGGWGWYNTAVAYDVPLFAGETITFTLAPSSNLDLGMALLKSNGTTFFASRGSGHVMYGDSWGISGWEQFTYTVPADDVYGLVVWSNNSADGSFTIQVGPGQLAMAEEVTYWNNGNPGLFNYTPTAGPYWAFVGTRPFNGTDATLKLYDDANFIWPLETSAEWGANSTEFIAVDYNHASWGSEYLRVLRGGGTGEYYTQWEQDGDILYGAEYPPYWGWPQVGKAWDVQMTGGQFYFFRQWSDGVLDAGMYLFDSSNGDYHKRRADWSSGSDFRPASDGGEWFWYVAPWDDWYGLVNIAHNGTAGNYSMWFGPYLYPVDEVPVTRSEPVVWATGPVSANYWHVAAARPAPGDGVNMWLYTDPDYSNDMFQAFDGGSGVRMVVADYNHISGGTPMQTLTQRYPGSWNVDHSWEGGADGIVFSPSGASLTAQPWEASNVAKAFDVYIEGSVPGGQNCRIEVSDDTGTLNLGVALFSSNGAALYQGLGSAYAYADANGTGAPEAIEFNVTAGDWYGLVIFNQNTSAGSYSIHMWDPTILSAGTADTKPLAFDLRSKSANPFYSKATLDFSLMQAGPTDLVIYDVQGRQVTKLVHGDMPAGQHAVTWDGQDIAGRAVAPGVYIAKLVSGSSERRIKLMKAD